MTGNMILTQMIIGIAVDEQARKRLFIVIITPVLVLIFLIAFILYLLTSPVARFVAWTFGSEEIEAIESFQEEYGYNQNLSRYGRDYIKGNGQSYEIGRAHV